MNDAERVKLLRGPYQPPRYRLGKKLFCQIRGRVTVRRISDGPIPWPQTIVGGNRTYILCGDLVKAVRRESEIAVAHWWGVGQFTVWKWRKTLDVPATNEGTARLRRVHFDEPWAHKARKKAWSNARDPVRRAKIAAANRGKPRPRHVIEAMAAGRRGKPHTEEARRKMSEAQRRRGTRPPKAGPAWKPAEDALLGRMPDEVVAIRVGRTVGAVQHRRRELRIEKFESRGRGLASTGRWSTRRPHPLAYCTER